MIVFLLEILMLRTIKIQHSYVEWDIVYKQNYYVGAIFRDSSMVYETCPEFLKDKVRFLVKLLEKERQKDE